ncbi:hypothetical protein BJX64DRAFT_248764 [Aspergillus heterothallicus]
MWSKSRDGSGSVFKLSVLNTTTSPESIPNCWLSRKHSESLARLGLVISGIPVLYLHLGSQKKRASRVFPPSVTPSGCSPNLPWRQSLSNSHDRENIPAVAR